MKITITDEKEKCIRDLFDRYTHVVVQPQTLTDNPVRLREPMISDLPLFSHKPWLANKLEVLDKWTEEGGVLLNFSFNQILESVGEHDAHIHIECPINMKKFNNDTVFTKSEKVIYRPPTWKNHERYVDHIYPHKDTIQRVWIALQEMREEEMSNRNRIACEAMKVSPIGIVACTDSELSDRAMISISKMPSIRKVIEDEGMQRHCKIVYSLVPRIEPTDHALREIFDKIKAMPEQYRGERMFSSYGMVGLHKSWRRNVKALVREGSIEKKHPIYIYPIRDVEPDWYKCMKDRDQGFADLEEMKKLVEDNS